MVRSSTLYVCAKNLLLYKIQLMGSFLDVVLISCICLEKIVATHYYIVYNFTCLGPVPFPFLLDGDPYENSLSYLWIYSVWFIYLKFQWI